jgi:hypothetical protein
MVRGVAKVVKDDVAKVTTKVAGKDVVVAVADSVNTMYKEYIEKMPSLLETKKDIGEYEKEFWKTHKDKVKELKAKAKADAKADAKATKATKPSKRKNAVDEEGNVKVRAPTAYNVFVKEQRPIVKEARPDLSNKEIFAEIARMWQVKKEGGIVAVKEKSEHFEDAEEDAEEEEQDDEDDEDEEEDEDDDEEEADA